MAKQGITTGTTPDDGNGDNLLAGAVKINSNFDLRPRGIIEDMKLLRPIYTDTSAYGHFGREKSDFTWEKTDNL